MRRFLFVAAFVFVFATAQFGVAAAEPYRVCLDPGHGGSDPGAVYSGLVEKEVTLDIAKRVAAALDPALYVTKLTRDGDTTLGNSDRAVICNAFGAQVVLSIHLNASSDATVDYAWIFYGKPLKDKAFAATMDRAYAISQPDGNGPLPHKAITNFANGTLLKSKAPAALAECLFMSNTLENAQLAAADPTDPNAPPSRRQQIANELVKGIRAWAGR
ncbi:MAG TPA: N-acetylmuramoyl-L-alanine amidase [Candidatus Limnocylindria bacterium]|nr:N-acetylmuramoyl-L-alanine amidase [Candidatus Limnocylindria bacterium]